MKYGVVFPQTEIGHDPAVVRDFVVAAEQMGYDYLLAYEHVLGANPQRPGGWRGPYTHEHNFHEPFTLFAWLAAFTTRIEFTTGVLVLPQRQTALVAKQAAQVDLLSGGRLRLGIGIGWNEVEYEALGMNFKNRGRRSEEQVQLLRELWTKPLVNFRGRDHSIPDAGLKPLPIQRPIPIWFGGMADVVIERMAKLGDGWMPQAAPLDRARKLVERLHEHLQANGRDPRGFGIDMRVTMAGQAEWQDYIGGWQELGATHVCINTMGAGYTHPDEHLAGLQRFKEAMGF